MTWRGKQSPALLDRTRELDIEGALRASKTTICLWKEFNACQQEPGIHTMLCRWTDDAVHGILKPVWRQVCEQAGIALHWNGEEQFDQMENGSKIYIRGLKSQDQVNRYSKFRGLTLARVYLDQAEEVPQDVYLELASRLSQLGYSHQITISPNAVEETHWIAKEFPADNRNPHRKYYSLSVHDNAHNLPAEVIPALERLYPLEHPKHRTMVLGLRGMNVYGVPVYQGAFRRELHERALSYNYQVPLDEAIDFGKHHPCVVWRQTSPFGEVQYLGGILGQGLYLEDFLPLVQKYRSEWFPNPVEIRTCCDPAGASDNSHGVRDNGVKVLKSFGFRPQFHPNANAPDVRLAMIERQAAYMRKRTPQGEMFGVNTDHWLRISADNVVVDNFLCAGFEAGYVWDEHWVSVGSKQMRKPKKDGWYEHGQNCSEYLELNFGTHPWKKPRPIGAVRQPIGSAETAWLGT